jgi:hypothetical protein
VHNWIVRHEFAQLVRADRSDVVTQASGEEYQAWQRKLRAWLRLIRGPAAIINVVLVLLGEQ